MNVILMGLTAALMPALQEGDKVKELEKRVTALERKIELLEEFLKKMLTEGLPKMQKNIGKAIERAKVASCANHLSQLWKMQNIYRSQFGGKLKLMPKDTGAAFWLALSKTVPRLVDSANSDIFVCPLSGAKPHEGFTTYRGPAVNVASLRDDAVVGCCEPGSHPDGSINVLRKSGDVVVAKPGEALYEKAVKNTLGSPPRFKRD